MMLPARTIAPAVAQRCRSTAFKPTTRSARRVVVRAEKGTKEKKKPQTKVEEYEGALKQAGVTPELAKNIMAKWQEVGADADPKALRQLFLNQSLLPIGASVLQLLVDGFVAYSAYIASIYFSLAPQFPGRNVLVVIDQFVTLYFAFVVVIDVATLTAVLVSTVKLGANPEAFYDAVKDIAGKGPAKNLSIVDKAQTAVNAFKVAQALDSIAGLLDKAATSGPSTSSTDTADMLKDLNVYVTLQRAEQRSGFNPKALGLSEKEASRVASVFGQFDSNDDGYIDVAEVRRMLASLGQELSEGEARAALKQMDKNGDGLIDFEELAEYWAGARKK